MLERMLRGSQLHLKQRVGMKISFKKFNARLGLALAAAALVAGCSDTASYYKYSQVVVFGASLSDTGNVFAASGGKTPGPAPYYFGGRWSNGPLWIENVAAEVGKTVTRSSAGGTNFAYGGAKTCGITGVTSSVPDMCTQVALFLGATGGKADSEALLGQYKEIGVELTFQEEGQEIRQRTGAGVLRIDPAPRK